MNNGFSQRMRECIAAAPDGSVITAFVFFSDIAGTATISRCINRIVSENVLRRVIRGVLEKPRYSRRMPGICLEGTMQTTDFAGGLHYDMY